MRCRAGTGLTRFVDNGRIEIDFNVVERSIRPIALNRKNALFAGSDGGGEHWAIIASLIETCKLNGVDPHAYLIDVISKIVNGHPNSRIDELLPWAYPTGTSPKKRGLKTALTRKRIRRVMSLPFGLGRTASRRSTLPRPACATSPAPLGRRFSTELARDTKTALNGRKGANT